MIHRRLLTLTASLLPPTVALFASPKQDSGSDASPPRQAVEDTVRAVEKFVEGRSEESLQAFLADHLSTTMSQSQSQADIRKALLNIRRKFSGFGGIRVGLDNPTTIKMIFEGPGSDGTPLFVHIDPDPPYRIVKLRIGEPDKELLERRRELQERSKRLSWDTLDERLDLEEKDGFAGTVLIVRDNKIVLHKGYGFANREQGIKNGPDTVFAIGSIPIDFTKAAILKLVDTGKLKLTDPIMKFLPNVPVDKQAITIDQLMTGRSGLRNFHERPNDENLIFSWIDRETAVKRILEGELLFPPGTDHAHSHSAFGLLAAIIERVSGETYDDYLSQQLFATAGMKHTGHYGEAKFKNMELAVGYGDQSYGKINSPAYWGKTSWLAKGSGGMLSTAEDLYRWVKALRDGKLLSSKSLRKYWSPSGAILAGGNSYGFFAAYTEGPRSMVFLCSNSGDSREETDQLIRDLAQLVRR